LNGIQQKGDGAMRAILGITVGSLCSLLVVAMALAFGA
jgi:hypothetical protein